MATFNVENLLARYKFADLDIPKESLEREREEAPDGFFNINTMRFSFDQDKQFTAQLIREINADVVALQEIESLEVVELFVRKQLGGMYPYCVSISAHDVRQIYSAIISKYPIGCIRTNRHEISKTGGRNGHHVPLFPRDCLEVEIVIPNPRNPHKKHSLWLFNNHFTSMSRGRLDTYERRQEQADFVAHRIEELYKPTEYRDNFIVLGDLNDKNDEQTSLHSLLQHEGLENVVERLPKGQQWTHYYAQENTYQQLDYILVSKPLMEINPDVKPKIWRQGLPRRAKLFTGSRYSGIGEHTPKASDHAAVSTYLRLF